MEAQRTRDIAGEVATIRALLEEHDRTQVWLARQLRIGEATLSRYMHFKQPMPADVVIRTRRLFEHSLEKAAA